MAKSFGLEFSVEISTDFSMCVHTFRNDPFLKVCPNCTPTQLEHENELLSSHTSNTTAIDRFQCVTSLVVFCNDSCSSDCQIAMFQLRSTDLSRQITALEFQAHCVQAPVPGCFALATVASNYDFHLICKSLPIQAMLLPGLLYLEVSG